MWAVVILAILGVANSAAVEKRALQPMTGYQLNCKYSHYFNTCMSRAEHFLQDHKSFFFFFFFFFLKCHFPYWVLELLDYLQYCSLMYVKTDTWNSFTQC